MRMVLNGGDNLVVVQMEKAPSKIFASIFTGKDYS